MPKKQKIDRNAFLMQVAPQRCDAFARKMLSTRSMKLDGVNDFDGAMEAIMSLAHAAYTQGMTDAIDPLIDGRVMEPI